MTDTTTPRRRKPVRRHCWAGFTDGHIDKMSVNDGYGGFEAWPNSVMLALYTSRALAKKRYEDVRRVEIREVTNG